MCTVQWHLLSPLHKNVGTQCHVSYVGIDTPDPWRVTGTQDPTHSKRCMILLLSLIVSLQELCLCCVISDHCDSRFLSALVLMVLPGNTTPTLSATLTPAGCSTHHQSWRTPPSGGVNTNYNLIALHKGSLHCTANYILSAKNLLPDQVCPGQVLLYGQQVQCRSHCSWACCNSVVAMKGQC